METLKVEKETAKKLYPESPKWFQEVLINTFGKKFFSKNITDRVTSFEDAWEEADEETRKDPEYIIFPTDSDDVIAYKQLKVICKVFRGNKDADYGNTNQKKWFPIFKWSSGSGFDFSDSIYYYDDTTTAVGSRLCVFNEATSDYLGKQFISIYRTFLTKNK